MVWGGRASLYQSKAKSIGAVSSKGIAQTLHAVSRAPSLGSHKLT